MSLQIGYLGILYYFLIPLVLMLLEVCDVFVMCVTKVSFFLIDTGLVRLFISNKHTAREEGATRNDQHMQACANISWLSPLVFLFGFFLFLFLFLFR